jgi:hypothetical protein
MMTAKQAAAFVREHGVVLMSASGPVPRLVEAIAGEPIKGSWWAHPRSRAIYQVLQAIEDSPDVLIEHTDSGRHINRTIDYPDWVPDDVKEAARRLSKEEAARMLSPS